MERPTLRKIKEAAKEVTVGALALTVIAGALPESVHGQAVAPRIECPAGYFLDRASTVCYPQNYNYQPPVYQPSYYNNPGYNINTAPAVSGATRVYGSDAMSSNNSSGITRLPDGTIATYQALSNSATTIRGFESASGIYNPYLRMVPGFDVLPYQYPVYPQGPMVTPYGDYRVAPYPY